jgi:CheY-like chemotaxis protein
MNAAPAILVVDDSKVSRLMTCAIIRQRYPSARLHEAADGCEALNEMLRHSFDLAILDMNMPGMTGMQVAEAAVQDFPDTRLAMLTANVQASSRKRAEELGVSFFGKPITEKVIGDILRLLEDAP